MVKRKSKYTIPGDPPPDPTPWAPAVADAEKKLEKLGRDMMRRVGEDEPFGIMGILSAVEEWIRSKDGRETKMCISCSKTSVPAYGLRWARDVTYTCTACKQPELSIGEIPIGAMGETT